MNLPDTTTWTPPELPEEIQYGDMPGDVACIDERHIMIAQRLFPVALDHVLELRREKMRTVISVCGGSGVGKTEISSLLTYYFKHYGVQGYTISGDNYVRRIPVHNDTERLRIFRQGGLSGLLREGEYTSEHAAILKQLQLNEEDACPVQMETFPWMSKYVYAGRRALEGYLGTPDEINFDELSNIIAAYSDGEKEIWLRRLGREDTELWYDPISFPDTHVLFIEWTHSNSDFLRGVDIPIFLYSTPQETLKHRRRRKRDQKTDSKFTALVLDIEHKRLISQAEKARLIVSRNGEFISYSSLTWG